MNKEYHESMQITKAFRFCPNAFRIDMYRGCDFGCRYCFANMEWKATQEYGWAEARLEKIQKRFELAFDTPEKESKDILIELLRHKVPLHCGGMSDPFQNREWKYELTYKLIELCNKYDYPIVFSTKTANLPEKYFDILTPRLHAFQVSIMGFPGKYTDIWESNTPTSEERVDFVRKLREKGFWCSIRIQPIINIKNVLYLIRESKDIPSYYTVEHLRMIYDNEQGMKCFHELIENKKDFINTPHHLEFKRNIKIENIRKIQELANSYGVR